MLKPFKRKILIQYNSIKPLGNNLKRNKAIQNQPKNQICLIKAQRKISIF